MAIPFSNWPANIPPSLTCYMLPLLKVYASYCRKSWSRFHLVVPTFLKRSWTRSSGSPSDPRDCLHSFPKVQLSPVIAVKMRVRCRRLRCSSFSACSTTRHLVLWVCLQTGFKPRVTFNGETKILGFFGRLLLCIQNSPSRLRSCD